MKRDRLVAVGTSCVDEYYDLDENPVLGEKVICRQLPDKVGGMIGNATAVYASYGQPASMIDFMNGGDKAQWLIQDMKDHGVDTSGIGLMPSLPDPKCIIMLHGGERLILVVENQKKDLELSKEQIQLLDCAAYVYATTIEMRALQDTMDCIRRFRKAGAKLVLDVEANTITGDELDRKILQSCDILFSNESGAARMRETFGARILENLSENGCTMVITLAEKGCEILRPEGPSLRIKGLPVKVVDTTGAGDTFNASFLYGLSQGWDIPKTAEFANFAAARAIGLMGPRSGAAGSEAVYAFIKEHRPDFFSAQTKG